MRHVASARHLPRAAWPPLALPRYLHTGSLPDDGQNPSYKGKERAHNEPLDAASPEITYKPRPPPFPMAELASSSRLGDNNSLLTLSPWTNSGPPPRPGDADPLRQTSDDEPPIPPTSETLYSRDELLLRRIHVKYPFLSADQAKFMAGVYTYLQDEKRTPTNRLINWYQEHVWTQERHAALAQRQNGQGSDRELLETAPCLNLVLRFAYARGDSLAVFRLGSRAYKRPLFVPPPDALDADAQALTGDLWPDASDDPLQFAFNYGLALEARFGKWTSVRRKLFPRQPLRNEQTDDDENGGMLDSGEGQHALNEIGWAELLRHGLGKTKEVDPEKPLRQPHMKAQRNAVDVTKSQKTLRLELQRREEARQMVTSRLISRMLRPTAQNAPAAEPSDALRAAPSWLLMATLDNLAERGEMEQVTRLARTVLAELRALPSDAPSPYKNSSAVIDAVLKSHRKGSYRGLHQMLAAYAEFAGVDIARNTKISGRMALEPAAHALYLQPSEASLVTLLHTVTVPHQRTRWEWSWGLYKQFRADFPHVKVTSRTFRVLLLKAVSNVDRLTALPEPDGPAAHGKTTTVYLPGLTRTCQEMIDYVAARSVELPRQRKHIRTTTTVWLQFQHQCDRITRLLHAYRTFHERKLTPAPAHQDTWAIAELDKALTLLAHIQTLP